MIDAYLSMFSYNISLLILTIGSLLIFCYTRKKSAFVFGCGYCLAFLGNLLVDFGPKQISYTEDGAIISFSPIFTIGRYLGMLGIIVAAFAFLIFAFHFRNARATGFCNTRGGNGVGP